MEASIKKGCGTSVLSLSMAKFLLLLSSLWALSLAACPSGSEYDSSFNRCYKFVVQPTAFFLAEQNCIADGGHLASIQNGFENALIAETVQNTIGMANKYYWIGANQLMSSNWSWSDGAPFVYTNWASTEPNGTYQCGAVQAGGGLWKTVNCAQAQPYVCVIPGDAAPTSPPPCPTPGPHVGYCQSGWTYFDQTDFCYKVLLSDNFENAEATCVAANSHLASIHSDAENTFVADLATTGMTVDWDWMTWIGMHKVNNQWVNTDGTKVDYYHWAPGQPDNSKGIENCVQILSDELSGKGHSGYHTGWNDIACTDNMRALVCKRPALHN